MRTIASRPCPADTASIDTLPGHVLMPASAPCPAPSAELLARIDAREAGLSEDETLVARSERLSQKLGPSRIDERRLWQAATAARSSRQRVVWLRRALEPVLAAVADDSACRAGCAHCCHIAVQLTEREARVIAMETGRPLREPAAGASLQLGSWGQGLASVPKAAFDAESQRLRGFQAEATRRYKGERCPFLSVSPDGESDGVIGVCTIYSSRPLACRQLVNMDRDALLCHLVRDRDVNVPYLDMRWHAAVQLELLGSGQRIADIRDWFGTAEA